MDPPVNPVPPHQRHDHHHKKSKSSQGDAEDDAPQDVYYLIPRTVTVLYGPYMFQGMMDYRTERLQGIKTFLEKLGVTVNLTPCLDHVNLCRVWFLDELIFSCKITDLMHGGDGGLDPFCWEAAEKLENFIKKVLKGLRKQRPAEPEELKKPFCPCFQVDHTQHEDDDHLRQVMNSGSDIYHRDSKDTQGTTSERSSYSKGLEMISEGAGLGF